MASISYKNRGPISKQQLAIRKRYLGATFVTLIVVTLIAGTVHVLELGQNRMNQMRNLASYDLKEEQSRLRAAGEIHFRNKDYEKRKNEALPYSIAEAKALLTEAQWAEVNTMMAVPAGAFIMGTDNKKTDAQNRPAHHLDLAAYEIDKHPVTNAQYALFVAETGHIAPFHWKDGRIPDELALHPVTMVSWFDAMKYAAWAGKHLPTEEQWEKAARGQDGRRWPWGNSMERTRLNTYYNQGATTPIGAYPRGASPFGVYDMAGNVSEWMANDFLAYANSVASDGIFKAKVAQIPLDPGDREKRMVEFVETDQRYKVMRGGSWKSDPFSTSAYHRNFALPFMASDFFGFRCAKAVTESSVSATDHL